MAVEPSRWGIIYNPKAGSRKTQKRWNEIRDYMESRKVVFDYVQSESAGCMCQRAGSPRPLRRRRACGIVWRKYSGLQRFAPSRAWRPLSAGRRRRNTRKRIVHKY